ncbi:MAG TPA: NADPH:quinone reductase [Thermodesulfobacteriota bacterium]|nr:NADPH:quinone reductase [Thermodesulfobacteriota bacterium]
MKAIRVHEFGEPEKMRLEEVPDPQCGPGQVLVRVHAVGVNPVDTYIRAGLYAIKPKLPYVPGSDASGTVEAVGERVKRFKLGDRVYTAGTISGAYAEKTLCLESQVHSLPPKVTYSQSAALNVPYSAAYRALFQRARAVPGEAVLVHGASGGVGIAVLQFSRAAGMMVMGTAGTEQGRQLAAEQGAHCVLDHRSPYHFEEVLRLTDNRGVDVIVELLANVNLGKDLGILAKGGRAVVIGSRGTVEVNPRDAIGREAAILGMSVFNATERETVSIHAAIGAGLENGTLRPVIGQEMPLADAPRAHRKIIEATAFGKIILVP